MKRKLLLGVQLVWLLAMLGSPGYALPLQDLAMASDLTGSHPMTDGPVKTQQKDSQTLKGVLEKLQSEYKVYFTYDLSLVENQQVKVEENMANGSVEDVLDSYLVPLNLQYRKTGDKYYVIYRQRKQQVEKIQRAQPQSTEASNVDTRNQASQHQPWLSSTEATLLQMEVMDKNISGKVTDGEDGSGLPGVNILAKGTTIGTITDVDGNYNLSVPDETTTLIFSSVGYEAKEVDINGRTTIDMGLMPDIQSLSEIVVVGYGEQKKVTVTGSVAQVEGKELTKSPNVNLSNSLAGRIPGVFAVNRSGEPGYDGSAIRIRGTNTLGNNDALIVVDGVPARAGGLDRINPADIESVSVLKDASAAIYGARAANGVILITTKRGKTGKPQLSYSFNQGWAQPTRVPDLANATQFAEMRNELEIFSLPVEEWQAAQNAFDTEGVYIRNDGSELPATYTPEDIELFRNGSDPWGHPNTNWYDATLKNWSPQTQHNVQLSGGTDDFRYVASLGYQNQDAFYKNSATGYKQYDIRINLDGNINKYIKTTVGILGRQENRFFPTVGAGQIFRMQMRGIPTSPAYWPNGLPGPDIENGTQPVVVTTNQTGYDDDKQNYIQTNGSLEISIPGVEGLKVTGTAAVDKRIRQTKRWNTPWFLYSWEGFDEAGDPIMNRAKRGPAEPNLNQGNEDQLNILLGGTVNYTKAFGDHNLNFLAGVNRETIEYSGFGAFRRFFISDAIDQIFAGGDLQKDNSGGAWERARLSYFGRVAYNYQEKYLLEFLWRYDGSYMFPEDERWGFFPGVLAGWVVSEENFWKDNISFMDFLKIRGSYGQMGNDNITLGPNGPLLEYQYLSTYGFRSYIVGGQETKTLYETRVPNTNVTWEVANNANIGIEGQMLEGRIFFEFDYFINKRTNILWPKFGSVPQSTGMTLPPENIGEVKNVGYDFNVGYNGQIGDVNFSASVNGGYAQNEILYWDEAPGAPAWQRTTGKPMYTYQLYEHDGVFATQADIDANTIDYSALTNTLRPGDMKYKDLYGPDGVPDGKITPDDQIRTDYTSIPLFQGGINLSASYKNFDLSILFQGATGAKLFVITESGSIGNYLLDTYENRWQIDNPSSTDPRIADRNNQWYSTNNTYWLRDADYLRLKNFEIGYNLPVDLLERVGVGNLRIYTNGLNLFTIDKLKVLDPESDSQSGQYYPQSRILNLGATITF